MYVTHIHQVNNYLCVWVTVTIAHQIAPKLAYSQPRMDKQLLQERVRSRLRRLVQQKDVSHEVLAKFLGVSRSHVTRLLNEDGAIMLPLLEKFCTFFQLSAAEIVMDEGALIQPISAIEAAVLAHIRQMTELERRSLLTILERPIYAAPSRQARMGRAMLSAMEQELVDLFARVQADAIREGVLRTLRGAVKHQDTAPHPRGAHRNE